MNEEAIKCSRDVRATRRKNIYLAAVLEGARDRSPATIRNLSASGAMIETAVAPDLGTAVNLVRGSLCAGGRIAWRDKTRCGLSFNSQVSVDDWLAPPANGKQQAIDDAIRSFRTGVDPLQQPIVQDNAHPPSAALFAEILEIVADSLIRRTDLAATCAIELQSIDLVVQALHASSATGGDGRRRAGETVDACKQALEQLNAQRR